MDNRKTWWQLFSPILFLAEYGSKLLAGVGAAIVLAAEGSFFMKLWSGFSSIGPVMQNMVHTPENIRFISQVVTDYNSMTAARFNEKYGGQAINHLLERLNEGVVYFQAIYQNMTTAPVGTVSATLLIFLLFYLLGRLARFIRQKGRGSVFDRIERRMGQRFFGEPSGSSQPENSDLG
ncbi:MAG: hypothetical protein R3281_10470 [Balneolaceae bacterium]|nr:hypothetical protein [Balneolaceae bacterium]